MANLNRRMPSIGTGHFSMVPRNDVPRSTFQTQHSLKSTFNTGDLIPIFVDEVLPGDSFQGDVTVFARLNTLLFPLMDNLELETFFFFVPCRLVWTNWVKMMGEQTNPADSIAFTVPQHPSPAGGFAVCSLADYFGCPTVGQVLGGNIINVNALPFRAYYLIRNTWFRDENLESSNTVATGDGPDGSSYAILKRNKKHDYFTSALPWPLKGGVQVNMPLAGIAPVTPTTTSIGPVFKKGVGPLPTLNIQTSNASSPAGLQGAVSAAWAAGDTLNWGTTNLQVDLSSASGATINAMRLAVTTQQLLERDARGGTRYTELLRSHFGVMPEDSRLDRPEYIGGGRSRIQTSAIPQTSATGLTGGSSPLGALGAQAVVADSHRFGYHATEHGYMIGLANVRADLTYQQGLHRMWSRTTRYDFYLPVFANLGEQIIRNDEIYADGSANDVLAFGYQERWAEYRHRPSRITGLFKSRSAGTIDPWHAAQNFLTLPALNTTFINEAVPMSRVLAAGAAANNMQILFDSFWEIKCTRAMPVYSVPGLLRF